jgi:hypothetical protein
MAGEMDAGRGAFQPVKIGCLYGTFGACITSPQETTSGAIGSTIGSAQRPAAAPEGTSAAPAGSGSATPAPAGAGGSIGSGGPGPGGAAVAVAVLLLLAAWWVLDQLALLIPTGIVLPNQTPPA